ncbi:MAG TPA: hypothetical protein VHO25_00620 [Polyangiaceae bacterium]|nr:hypothetical protein [Polyangiaceae bacterium]
MTKKPLSVAQVRKLAWPSALLQRAPLSVDDCYQVGQLVVEKVQQDGSARVRARKEWSMRRLQKELGVASAATFTRCVQVYEMARELQLKRPLQGVSSSSLFLVAGLPKAVRAKVARKALGENWSKRRIEAELASQHGGERRSGRPPGLGCIKALSRCVSRPLLADLEQLPALDAVRRKGALKQLQRLLADTATLRRSLAKAAH